MNIAFFIENAPREKEWNGFSIRYENVGISGTEQSFLLVAEYLARTNNVYFISETCIHNTQYKNVQYKHSDFLQKNSDIFDILIIPSWCNDAFKYSYKNLKQLVAWAQCPDNIDENIINNFMQNRHTQSECGVKAHSAFKTEDSGDWQSTVSVLCTQLKINTMSEWCTNYIKLHRPYTDKYFTYFTVPNPLMVDIIEDKIVKEKEKNTFLFSAVFERGGHICVEAFNRLSLQNKHLDIFSYFPDDKHKIRNMQNITMHGSSGKQTLYKYLSKTEYFIYPLVLPYERGSPVHKDTFACVIAEALAHEVIVLTYPVGALPELYEDTVAWLDFPKGSNIQSLMGYEQTNEPLLNSEEAVQNIVNKINEIEANPSYKESLKRKGKQLVYKKFHSDIIGKAFEKELELECGVKTESSFKIEHSGNILAANISDHDKLQMSPTQKEFRFHYKNNFGIINDYYQMIVETIKKIITNNPDMNINITLCDNDYVFNNKNKTIKININWEHTLVKKGGRSVPENTPYGNITDDENNKYFVRIDRYNELNNSDIIIDYSIPNIYNVKSCNNYNFLSKKHVYISSSLYDSYFIKENRKISLLTTFINTNEPRRAQLLNNLYTQKIEHININNCFDKDALQQIYKNTRILINIHQTPHHHTFEELRVLPALQCGVIVICENSPLSNLIPYHDYIIWTSYDKIIEKTTEIINNYDYYYDMIFSKEKRYKLSDFSKTNYNVLNDIIRSTVLSNIKYTPSPYGASSIDDILDKDGRPSPLILTPQRGVLNISGYGTVLSTEKPSSYSECCIVNKTEPSLCFIIACKVYRQYYSYIDFYVSNIKEYYPTALIILVDNNSKYNEYYNIFKNKDNIILLENTSESKFELGAYKFATEYIKNNNLYFDYYVCTQDTFVLVNKYDFNILKKNNIKACAISHFEFHRSANLHINTLKKLNLYDPREEFLCCWCSSWCCDHNSLLEINKLLYSIIPIIRTHSEETERYMGKILKLLNNNTSYSIEIGFEGNNYNCHTINIQSNEAKQCGNFFIKRAQQKTETTPE